MAVAEKETSVVPEEPHEFWLNKSRSIVGAYDRDILADMSVELDVLVATDAYLRYLNTVKVTRLDEPIYNRLYVDCLHLIASTIKQESDEHYGTDNYAHLSKAVGEVYFWWTRFDSDPMYGKSWNVNIAKGESLFVNDGVYLGAVKDWFARFVLLSGNPAARDYFNVGIMDTALIKKSIDGGIDASLIGSLVDSGTQSFG